MSNSKQKQKDGAVFDLGCLWHLTLSSLCDRVNAKLSCLSWAKATWAMSRKAKELRCIKLSIAAVPGNEAPSCSPAKSLTFN